MVPKHAHAAPVASTPGEVTRLLDAMGRGQAGASDQLLPLVYDELRRLAASRLSKDAPGQTLQPTALVHEAYLRLVGGDVQWQNHAHFFGAAALAMKRILIERARRKQVERAARPHVYVTELDEADPERVDMIALDGALEKLAGVDAQLSQLVHLRFFAGLTVEQTAEVLGSSARTVKRDWSFARAWLHRELGGAVEG
jgi:RNA polymerase sigma factor (TIGR02999 family)